MAKLYLCWPVNWWYGMEDLQHLFHELVGAGHALPLMELNPSMMVADVLQSGGQFCALCQSHDHRKEECTLAPPSAENVWRLRPIESQRCVTVSTDR